MPTTLTAPVLPPTLSANYCFTTWQQVANDLVGGATVQFDSTGATFVLKQNFTPDASQRAYLWFNTDTSRTLYYLGSAGKWVSRNSESPSNASRRIFTGLLADIDTYDGGSVGTVGDVSGPMWERDTAFNDNAPYGVGVAITPVLATGGASTSTIAQVNLPAVTLSVNTPIIGQASVGAPEAVVGSTYGSTAVAGSGRAVDSTSSDFSGRYLTKGQTETLGSGTALNVQNKYVGVYFIRRTSRIYYET